jgi:UDP-N-acetylmuramoyl-tripeptide--D-alanyl-D-alanine ligase
MFSVDDVRAALAADLTGERAGAAGSFSGVINDSRVSLPGQLFVALKTEARDGHDFIPEALSRGVRGVVVHRDDILLPEAVWAFRVRDTRHAIGELARYWRRQMPARAVVVTGNTGKTTTKELVAAVLSRRYNVLKSYSNFNDEVGLAMTIFELTEAHERAVFEVGMFVLGEIRRLCEIAQPVTAVVLNVGPTHLERLGSMEAIARAKAEAVEALPASGNAILNADDPYVAPMATRTSARVMTFGIDNHAEIRASDLRSRGLGGVEFMLSCPGRSLRVRSPLPGVRLVYNALAAIAVGIVEGMSVEEAVHALETAQVPQRLRPLLAAGGATILDDSYNASPASMLAALSVLAEVPGRRIALLGDMLELGSAEAEGHRQVGEVSAGVTDMLFTVGPRGALIAAAARAAGARFVHHFEAKEEATAELRGLLGPGDVLLVKASHGLYLGTVVQDLMQ